LARPVVPSAGLFRRTEPMRKLPAALIMIGCLWGCDPQSPVKDIFMDDYILVSGKIKNCEDWGVFKIAVGRVSESEVWILGHEFEAVGLSPAEFEESLKAAIAGRIGRWPDSLTVAVLSERVFDLAADDIEQDIDNYYAAIEACDKRIDEFREKSKAVAQTMHNR